MQLIDQVDDRVLRKPDVKSITGLTDSAIDREVRAGRFPKPFKLSPEGRAVGWSHNDVQSWLSDRKRSLAA